MLRKKCTLDVSAAMLSTNFCSLF